jgi:hypothetical protein
MAVAQRQRGGIISGGSGGGGGGSQRRRRSWCVVVKKKCFCVFSILMFGKEAVCPDGLFVPAVFREVYFYLNSLIYAGDSAMNNR